jgi:hypothetical protein
MNRFDYDLVVNTPFVYEDTILNGCKDITSLKKMYNRGQIMSCRERDKIYSWASELFKTNKMTSLSNGRYEKKLIPTDEQILPLVFEIKKRIDEREKLGTFKSETFINDFVAVIPKNGYIYKHTDPNDFQNNLFHIRFNVFISIPPNDVGTTYYNDIIINSIEGCYVLCRSGIDEHWSDVNTSDVPRISLSFGYLLPAGKIDELTSDAAVGTYTSYYPLVSHDIVRLSLLLNDMPRSVELEERGEKGSSIYTASNLMTNAQCDYIISYIERNSSLWKQRAVGYSSNVECNYITLDKSAPEYDILDSFIFSIIGKVLTTISHIQPSFKGTQDDGYTLRKIFGGTKKHVDGVHSKTSGFKNFVRCLSIIVVLNDDYDGGIFNFPKQNLKLKVKKGEAIMFPPYWTHPHSVTGVGEGQARYTINTWILEKFID